MNSMRDNNPRRGPGERRDRRFDSKREPRAAAPAPVEETAKVVEAPVEEAAEADAAATEAETIINYEDAVNAQ